MKSSEIKQKYDELLQRVKTDEYYTKIDLTNRVNCYVCDKGHITKTKDVDAGVTPFVHKCETCGDIAKSSFYQDIAPDLEPTEEWYRPTLKAVTRMHASGFLGGVDHALNGGLFSRKIIKK